MKVPLSNVQSLYANTAPGTVASPTAVDAAIQDIVNTINTNDDERANGLAAHQSAAILDHPNGSVTADKLATNSVETAKIKDGNVTTAKIADSGITTAKIADSNVTTAKIADRSITGSKIGIGVILAEHIGTGATSETVNGVRLDVVETEVLAYKEFGEQQNKTQQVYTYPTRINFGTLSDAPLADAVIDKGIDIIAHWYNDFGLEYTASAAGQANGAYLWYDWSWNHTNVSGYDSSRHPLLGWYKGDDSKVLDWICYWLVRSGVTAITIENRISTTAWATASDKHHWVYQLLNNAKNFKSLKYIPSLKYNGTQSEATAQHDDVINNIINVYKNVYLYQVNEKRYVTFFVFDNEGMRGVYDNYVGSANTRARYKAIAASMKTLGYDGACIMARNFSDVSFTASELQDLEANGVMMLQTGYEGRYDTDANYGNSFANYVNNVSFPTGKNKVVNIVTSAKSSPAHTSTWNLAGSTPDLFRALVQKAVNHIHNNNMPKILTIYNVSEWAEAGPSLQPNVRDGFGYLDALRSAVLPSFRNLDLSKLERKVVYPAANIAGGGAPVSYTPSLLYGSYHTVPFSGATSITVNNPTNAQAGDELILQFYNGNTSSSIAPTFGTAYKFSIVPTAMDLGKRSIYRFITDGATWYLTGYTENV